MTHVAIRRRASRLAKIARDGWNYPTLRLRPDAQPPVEAIRELGFDEEELRRYAREFDALAPPLLRRLADAAEAVGDLAAASRAAEPSSSSTAGKKLLYIAVRALAAETVVETGPFNGVSSTFILAALSANGRGRLVAFDRPDARDSLGVPVPAGRRPGWLVPTEMEEGFELVLGDIRDTLRPRLARERAIDLFFHDSLHTFRHMLFEYRVAWSRLASGGLLVSDDVFWNPAFLLFTRRHGVPFRHIGTVGITRKR
jgi:predicted O-methyltransferase YrrM